MKITFAFVLLGVLATSQAAINENSVLGVSELCAILPRGSNILKPKTCNQWIHCPVLEDGTDYEEGTCVAGLYFDKNENKCKYASDVVCPYAAQDNSQPNRCLSAENYSFLEDLNSCNGYVFCMDGQEIISQCPSGLVFNPQRKECVYAKDYSCPEKQTINTMSPVCRSIPSNKLFANDTDCTSYLECEGGILLNAQCSNKQLFDYKQGMCVDASATNEGICYPTAKQPEPENTFCLNTNNQPRIGYFSDGISCSGFYHCKQPAEGQLYDTQPVHQVCGSGDFFDENNWACRNRLNVRCTLDRCEGMGNKYVQVAGDCQSYVLCKNGVASTQGKCPNGLYFDERTQGCVQQVISYAACTA